MQIDCLVIGQGICGTFLSRYLQKAGFSFIVIDESTPFSASKSAAGIINPVTGRRIVKTWMIDTLLPFIRKEYHDFGTELNIDCISQKNIIDFFSSPQMRNAFIGRWEENAQYLKKPRDETIWRNNFTYDFGFGEIDPCWLVDIPLILSSCRKKLLNSGILIEERFNLEGLAFTSNAVEYKEIRADKIIFCGGREDFDQPFFRNLPFAPNKGEVLIAEIKDMPAENIFKKGISIVPWKENLFWIGSSFQWYFENDQPTERFREKTEMALQEWLQFPFKIVDHWASIRPATLERRPFVGFHPIHPQVGILNGMGSKGCSLAPFFANQLVENLRRDTPIQPEADLKRFTRVLGKNF
jgi:glycine/D-amino acid oxidase-like deaminating enzyme